MHDKDYVIEQGRAVSVDKASRTTLEEKRDAIEAIIGTRTETVYFERQGDTMGPHVKEHDAIRQMLGDIYSYFDAMHEHVNKKDDTNYYYLDLRGIVQLLEDTMEGRDTTWFQR